MIVWDLGGTVTHFDPAPRLAALANAAAMPADVVHDRIWTSGLDHAADHGLAPAEDIWQRVEQALDHRLTRAQIRQAWALAWRPDADVLDIILARREPAALFTNNGPIVVDVLRHELAKLTALFDTVVLSSEIRLVKPDPDAFAAAAAILQQPPGSLTLVDDAPANVAGARTAGWDAVLFTSSDQLRSKLPPTTSPAARDSLKRRKVSDGSASPSLPSSPVIVADDKDWTWVLDRRCDQCGFDVSSIPATDVPGLARQNAATWADLLASGHIQPGRPNDSTWSPLEYACHVRDVYRRYRGRLELMLRQDDPLFPNWDQDASAIEDGYDAQDPSTVVADLAHAAEAVARQLEDVGGSAWQRPGRRSDGASFTVDTIARYMIHDPVHHVWDVTSHGG